MIVNILVIFCCCISGKLVKSDISSWEAYNGDLPLIEYKGMTYYLEKNQQLSKYDAREFCHHYCMKLVIIKNENENSILRDVLIRYGENDIGYWTSGTRIDDKWFWGDDSSIEYFNWSPSEPDNVNSEENCIDIFVKKDEALWNDLSCTRKRNFICQKPSRHI